MQFSEVTYCHAPGAGVEAVTLSVPSSAVYGLLGPNGAGKTTLMRLAVGLLRPQAGLLSVLGLTPGVQQRTLAGRVGVMIEDPDHYGHLSGRANLDIYRRLRRLPSEQTDIWLDFVDLAHAAETRVSDYSLGMRQRLALARALLGNPEILVLDEPTNGLDPDGMEDVLRYVAELPARLGATVLLSSHVLADIESVCTHVAILTDGRVALQGCLSDLVGRDARIEVDLGAGADLTRAQALSEQVGKCGQVRGSTLHVPGRYSDEEIGSLLRRLCEADVPVVGLRRASTALRDLFAAATRTHTESST